MVIGKREVLEGRGRRPNLLISSSDPSRGERPFTQLADVR